MNESSLVAEYRRVYEELPPLVILGGQDLVRRFKAAVKDLELPKEHYFEHELAELIDYLHDRFAALELLKGYVDEAYRMYSEDYNAAEVELYCRNLYQLGFELYQLLLQNFCYGSQGTLWYEFDRLVSDEIVLRIYNDPELIDSLPLSK